MINIIKYGTIFNISSSLQSVYFKYTDIDTISISLLGSIIIIISTILNNETIQNDIHKNHILEYFNKDAFIISTSGYIQFILSIYILKNLPLSLTIPLSSLWLIISLFIEKLLLDIDIQYKQILIIIAFIFGICLINYHHFNNKTELSTNYFFSFLLIISATCKAFQQIYIKLISNKYSTPKLILMDFSFGLIFAILLAILNYKTVLKSFSKFKHIISLIIVMTITQNLKVYSRFNGIKFIDINLWNLVSNLTLLLSIILGYVFFNEKITKMQIIGSIIMIISIYSLRKYR